MVTACQIEHALDAAFEAVLPGSTATLRPVEPAQWDRYPAPASLGVAIETNAVMRFYGDLSGGERL